MIIIPENKRFKVNTPHIVHETIEGETIILNLKNGYYYSFDGIGPVIWKFIEKNAEIKQITQIFLKHFKSPEKDFVTRVMDFIARLEENELIIPSNSNDSETTFISIDELINLMTTENSAFATPILHKYADMQDVLLLDPIHDVNEKGWPEPKKD